MLPVLPAILLIIYPPRGRTMRKAEKNAIHQRPIVDLPELISPVHSIPSVY